jgi:beta-phosphoglucomutase-like phosphatase (HAD superfamily)
MAKRAFIFDLNGTMIDDMNFHIRAWYDILNQLGAELTLEQVNAMGKTKSCWRGFFRVDFQRTKCNK